MHKSVLLNQTLEYLDCKNRKIVLDCTVGGAGHAKEILKKLSPGGKLIGIDADKEALKIAEENLKEFKESSFTLVNENFRNFDKVLTNLGIGSVDAMLFDLGISSFQLGDEARGFSFSKGKCLDMRMDTEKGEPLWQALSRLREDELGEIIRDFGEERYWRKVAKAIVLERRKSPIREALRLAEIVRGAVRYSPRSKIDPATRTFQALRIFVNDELGALGEALDKIGSFLSSDGRVVIISFHSLEDRIAKHAFRGLAKEGILEILTKKPVMADEAEVKENPRSRSAKLRAAKRI